MKPTVGAAFTAAESLAAGVSGATARTARAVRLLPITVVRPPRAAQPLDQPLQLAVLEFRASLPHVERHHAPPLRGKPRLVDAVYLMARGARPFEQRFGVRVGEERRDLLGDIRA